jgi:hypothetical protein
MSIDKKSFLLIISLISVCQAFGQATASPFSTFGIGERYSNALTNNQGMAGVGVSQPQYWYANNQNPALLVYNTLTVFNAGVLVEQRKIKADTVKQKTSSGNLNYLVTAFPVKRGQWTTSISISPYTTVKYYLHSIETSQETSEKFDKYEQGTGGISQLSWSNGVRINDQFAVGLRASYLFGSIVTLYQNRSLTTVPVVNYYASIEEKSYVKDFAFSAGLSFSQDSLFARKKYRLSLGAVYDFSTNLNTRTRTMLYRSDIPGNKGQKVDQDTISNGKGSLSIPAGITLGASLGQSKWAIAVEANYYDWSTFRSVSQDDEGLQQSWKVAAGGELTPDAYSTNYLKRLTYRTGVSMEQLPYLANGNKVQDIGINFGLSIPAGRSSLDLGFRYGKRGNRADNLFEESYIRVFFGVSFNDNWFIKRKFD